jgi:diguanylate cyclase (GGDEF)-like protein
MFDRPISLTEVSPEVSDLALLLINDLKEHVLCNRVLIALNLSSKYDTMIYAKTRMGEPTVLENPETLEDQFHVPEKRIRHAFGHDEIWFGKTKGDLKSADAYQNDQHKELFQTVIPLKFHGKTICIIYLESESDMEQNQWLKCDMFEHTSSHFASEIYSQNLENKVMDIEHSKEIAEAQLVEREKDSQHFLMLVVALHQLNIDLSRTQNEQCMIKTAVSGALEHLDIDRLAVFLITNDMMQGTWGTDEQGHIEDSSYFRSTIPNHPMVQQALSKKDFVVVNESAELSTNEDVVGHGWNAMISLWDKETAIGWIACDNLLTGRPLYDYQKEILKLFGASLSQALIRNRAEHDLRVLNRDLEERVKLRTEELERTNEILKHISNMDGLTNISNRRFFDETLDKEWLRCRRNKSPISLIMIDVDFFKNYNDTLGHMQGDTALQVVARCLGRAAQRASDLVARYGGEEFVMLLPETNIEQAQRLAERARKVIEEAQLPHPKSAVSQFVTVSIGVSSAVPDGIIRPDHLILSADKALYSAKESGRNKVDIRVELKGEQE